MDHDNNRYDWVMVSNILIFTPIWGMISDLTNVFERGWNHQLDDNSNNNNNNSNSNSNSNNNNNNSSISNNNNNKSKYWEQPTNQLTN